MTRTDQTSDIKKHNNLVGVGVRMFTDKKNFDVYLLEKKSSLFALLMLNIKIIAIHIMSGYDSAMCFEERA